jgi:hypothetical protein
MFFSGTGFSREEAGMNTMDFCGVTSDAFPAKAGPTNGMRRAACDVFQWDRLQPGKGRRGHHGFGVWHPTPSRVGPASAGKGPEWAPRILGCGIRRLPG